MPNEADVRDERRAVPDGGWSAVKQAWTSPQRWLGVLVASAPTAVFVAVSAVWALRPALLSAGLTALAGFGLQLVIRRPIRSALIGVALVGICAGVAAATGEARGFFLVPAAIPFFVIAVCLASMAARRPLTGLLLNRVSGGPPRWWWHRALLRVHLIATGVCVLVNVVNGTLQVVFYRADDTVVLAAAHIATGPVFATIAAVTVVYARRCVAVLPVRDES